MPHFKSYYLAIYFQQNIIISLYNIIYNRNSVIIIQQLRVHSIAVVFGFHERRAEDNPEEALEEEEENHRNRHPHSHERRKF